MELTLTEIEKDAFIEFFNIGLSKSADALAQLVNDKVYIKCLKALDENDILLNFTAENIGLITDIEGEINGVSCLILNPEDAEYLVNRALPGKSSKDEIGKGFLLELDNIISAAVITQLSNMLNLNIYGGVPRLESWDSKKAANYKNNFTPFLFETQFKMPGLSFDSGFYWYLGTDIVERLRKKISELNA